MDIVELFRYQNAEKTYELGKEGRDGLWCHSAWNDGRNFSAADSDRTLSFDRLWALLLTTEIDRNYNMKYIVRAIYGGDLRSEGRYNVYIAAPLSSVKMQTKHLFEVQGRHWRSFISSLEEWAERNNIQLVHDRV